MPAARRPPGIRRRPASLVPGLAIRLLQAGARRVSPPSRAFPGRRAKDVHEAPNEAAPPDRTHAILEHLGRRPGAREGEPARTTIRFYGPCAARAVQKAAPKAWRIEGGQEVRGSSSSSRRRDAEFMQ